MPRAVIYVIITWAEFLKSWKRKGNRQSEFWRFHAQQDCKLTSDNKNLTLIKYIQFLVKKQNNKQATTTKKKTEQSRNDEKYWQTGITVKIHSNHEGARVSCFSLHFFFSCCNRFMHALQQNRAQSRLLYLLNERCVYQFNLKSIQIPHFLSILSNFLLIVCIYKP